MDEQARTIAFLNKGKETIEGKVARERLIKEVSNLKEGEKFFVVLVKFKGGFAHTMCSMSSLNPLDIMEAHDRVMNAFKGVISLIKTDLESLGE